MRSEEESAAELRECCEHLLQDQPAIRQAHDTETSPQELPALISKRAVSFSELQEHASIADSLVKSWCRKVVRDAPTQPRRTSFSGALEEVPWSIVEQNIMVIQRGLDDDASLRSLSPDTPRTNSVRSLPHCSLRSALIAWRHVFGWKTCCHFFMLQL